MAWYKYRQNNPGGRYEIDDSRGISLSVYVEARDEHHADVRATGIGLYLDGCEDGYDCSCCGDRWSPAQDYCEVSPEDVPAKDAPHIRDDNDSQYVFEHRTREDGEYETYVHPLDGSFYGAHGTYIHKKRIATGYGLFFDETTIGDVFEVGDDGWDVTGNRSAPAPGQRLSWTLTSQIADVDAGLRIESFESVYNGIMAYRLWSDDRTRLETIRSNVADFLSSRPKLTMSVALPGAVDEVKKSIREIENALETKNAEN